MNLLEKIANENLRTDLPKFRSGDTVRVHARIREGEKERVQVFEGVVIGRRRAGRSSSVTVRKTTYGVGVERVFPIYSPTVEKIEVVAQGKVRRSRLNYLRDLSGKSARIETKRWDQVAASLAEELAAEATEETGDEAKGGASSAKG